MAGATGDSAPSAPVPIDVLTHLTPARLARLAIDPGFAAIVRPPLVGPTLARVLAAGGDVTAAVAGDRLVGYVAIAPIEPVEWEGRVYHRRWEPLGCGRELGSIEVSRGWRGRRIAERLLVAAFADGGWDAAIVVSEELSWHWDLAELGLSKREYRLMLQRLLGKVGFTEYKTDEPNITADPSNILLVRLGPHAPAGEVRLFEALLYEDGRLKTGDGRRRDD